MQQICKFATSEVLATLQLFFFLLGKLLATATLLFLILVSRISMTYRGIQHY